LANQAKKGPKGGKGEKTLGDGPFPSVLWGFPETWNGGLVEVGKGERRTRALDLWFVGQKRTCEKRWGQKTTKKEYVRSEGGVLSTTKSFGGGSPRLLQSRDFVGKPINDLRADPR